jgi:hypothetical protein
MDFVLSTLLLAAALAPTADSGLAIGEAVTPFHPNHLAGPHKGTDACPPCTYGAKPQVLIFTNHEEDANTLAFAQVLHEEAQASDQGFRGFVINVAFCDGCVAKAQKLAGSWTEKKLTEAAFATVRGTDEALGAYKINLVDEGITNTVMVYKGKKVTAKFVNLKADKAGLAQLRQAIKDAH